MGKTKEDVMEEMYDKVNERWELLLRHEFVKKRPELVSFVNEVIEAYREMDMDEVTRVLSELQFKFKKYPGFKHIMQQCLSAK